MTSSGNFGRSSRYLGYTRLGSFDRWSCTLDLRLFRWECSSLMTWARLVPEWVSDWLPNLEAEIGMLLLIFGSVPLYLDMWRSR